MSLFRLDASIRTEGSVTRELADVVESVWAARLPDERMVRRDVGRAPLPADAWPAAANALAAARQDHTPIQRGAVALASALADEVLDADGYVLAVPLYNYGVSQHVKTWIDLLLTDTRLATGDQPALAGRPAVLVVARGGGYGPGTPREGWDHATAWLQRIFGDLLGLDVHLTAAELTLAGVTPAMEPLRELAGQSLKDAHAAATRHATQVADLLAAARAGTTQLTPQPVPTVA